MPWTKHPPDKSSLLAFIYHVLHAELFCLQPLVGHNLLTDILFMYEKFHNTLPGNIGYEKRFIVLELASCKLP